MRTLFFLLALLLASSALAARERAASIPGKSPNVLMIVSDDQAWTDFGFMGHSVIKTPHLDRLAAQSAVFVNGYVPTSLCRASLASIITGQYGHKHKICCNDPPDGVDRTQMHPFIRSAPALPRLLGRAGYRSLQTGKWWEGHYANGGFTHGMTVKGRHGDDGLIIGRQTLQPITDFIEQDPGKPWFIWYAPMMPHEPHNPPAEYLAKYQAPGRNEKVARYWAMCEWFDKTCGDVLAMLDRKGLTDNTLVLFVVDNGWIQETGTVRRTRGNFAPKSKLSPYDGGLRTPVMLRWPGVIPPSRRADLVSTIDLAPTVLQACEQPGEKAMDGLSLLPAARDGKRLRRDAVYGELYVHTAVDIEQPALNLTHRWVRKRDWKLIVPVSPDEKPELYNVAKDPMEELNQAREEGERVGDLTRLLNQWWSARR